MFGLFCVAFYCGEKNVKRFLGAQLEVIYLLFSQQSDDRMSNALVACYVHDLIASPITRKIPMQPCRETPLDRTNLMLAQLFHSVLINFLNFKLPSIVRRAKLGRALKHACRRLQVHINKHIKAFSYIFLCCASCLINFTNNILLHLI